MTKRQRQFENRIEGKFAIHEAFASSTQFPASKTWRSNELYNYRVNEIQIKRGKQISTAQAIA